MNASVAKLWFRMRFGLWAWLAETTRRWFWAMQGMKIGPRTSLSRVFVTWPHQVSLGARGRFEAGISFKFDGPWRPGPSIVIGDDVFIGRDCEFNIQGRIEIGRHTLIGAGSRFVDHDHGIAPAQTIGSQKCITAPIAIGADVWLGANVVVLKGVTIGDGAVVGACSLVRHSIPAGEIWAGVPARMVGRRISAGSRSTDEEDHPDCSANH